MHSPRARRRLNFATELDRQTLLKAPYPKLNDLRAWRAAENLLWDTRGGASSPLCNENPGLPWHRRLLDEANPPSTATHAKAGILYRIFTAF